MGARPGTMWAWVSLARSLVPMTKPARCVSGSFPSAASASTLNSANGVSIMAHKGILRSARRSNSHSPSRSRCSTVVIFGTRMPSGPAWAAAVKSSTAQGVSSALMRMITSRRPKPPAFTALTTCARAASLAAGATASSRSRMMPSTGSVRAFSIARAFDPGIKSTLRRGRTIMGWPRVASGILLEHDLFRKPVPTFRDHALVLRPLGGNGGGGEPFDRFAQALYRLGEVIGPRLAKQPHGGIPRRIFAVVMPAPIRNVAQERKGWPAERAGKMRRGGADRHDEIKSVHRRGGIGKILYLRSKIFNQAFQAVRRKLGRARAG